MSVPVRNGGGHWVPSIFNDFFSNNFLTRVNATAPAINVFECEKMYTVEVAAPGMTKDDFVIHLNDDGDLSIVMEKRCCKNGKSCDDKKEENKGEEERKGRYLRREFSYSKFQQTLILPDDVDAGKISASMENGVLTISIPKKEPMQHAMAQKQIEIK